MSYFEPKQRNLAAALARINEQFNSNFWFQLFDDEVHLLLENNYNPEESCGLVCYMVDSDQNIDAWEKILGNIVLTHVLNEQKAMLSRLHKIHKETSYLIGILSK